MKTINNKGWSIDGALVHVKFSDVEVGQMFNRLTHGYSREYVKKSETTARVDMSFYDEEIDPGETVEAHFTAKKK